MKESKALRSLIIGSYDTLTAFAKEVGMSKATLTMKLNKRVRWSQEDVRAIVGALSIPHEEVWRYFYE